MKCFVLSICMLLTSSAIANDFQSRTKYRCAPEEKSNPYILLLSVNDVGDQDGTVEVLRKSDQKVIRREEVLYKNGDFIFGESKETLYIFSEVIGFGEEFEMILGHATMNEINGSIYCFEIEY
jgi:hypothetical protein